MIEGTFYTDETDIFLNRIFESKTYLISKCEISAANKKFTTIKHDFRVIFKPDSLIEEVRESQRPKNVPGVNTPTKLNLATVRDILRRMDPNLFVVEVYGRIASCSAYEDITVNHSGKQLVGRYQIHLQDLHSEDAIRVNMWGFSEEHNEAMIEDDMMLIIGARVTDKFGDP